MTDVQLGSPCEVPDHVLRVAVVQLDYTPNTETSADKRWLPDEPLINWEHQDRRGAKDYSVHSGAIDADPEVRGRTETVLNLARRQREDHLDLKLKQILEFCAKQDVDLVVFPEALIPASLIPVLVRGFRSQLAVFAGVGTLRPRDAKTLQEIGFDGAEREVGGNAAVYVDREQLKVVTKRERAAAEVTEPGSGIARVIFRKGGTVGPDGVVESGTPRHLGLAICRDYVNAPRTFDEIKPMPDLVLVTALTRPTEDFLRTPRNFVVAFANHARQGGSAVMVSPLLGFFVDAHRRGTDPLPPGESIVIVDYEGFATIPSRTVEPANRQVCRASIVYDDPSPGDPAGSLSSLARQLRDLTLEGLNHGESYDLLSIAEARLQAMGGENSAVLLSAAQELRRNASTLASPSDLSLLKTHLILTDVKSETELKYETLGNLRKEWWDLFNPEREQAVQVEGISPYLEQVTSLRRELLPQVRAKHRDSLLTNRKSDGRGLNADSASQTADGLTTFYSARLGSYNAETAVRSLQQQLGVLRTISAADDESVRLIYQVSTALQTSGHLAPFFDVTGVTESTDEAVLEDLREGIGQQLATAYRSSWDVSSGPQTGTLDYNSVAELRLSGDAIPRIHEDWATLVDYLRTLAVPVTVQMTCRRGRERRSGPAQEPPSISPLVPLLPLAELSGFFFSSERDAAAFLERAHREETAGRANLSLQVHVGSTEPLPDSVLRAVGQWLFHAMPFEIVRGPSAREQLSARSAAPGGPSLTPSEILRVFHPPYGQMEGRGLDRHRLSSIPLPVTALSAEGLLLGKARIEGTRQDRWVDVRMGAAARLRHFYIVGPTGSGKTNLLKHLARQDIAEHRGIAVIDPHGDLVDYLVKHTHGRDDEVLLLDFGDPEFLPVLNPLDLDVESPDAQNLAIENFISLMVRQSHHTFYGPRFESMVRLALASCANQNYPFQPPSVLDVGTILRNEETKRWLQALLKNESGLSERWRTFDRQGGHNFAELLDWALAKFSEMEQDGTLRYVLAGGKSTVSLSRIVQNGGVLLVKIPEWEMSGSAAAFLGGFIQEHVRRAIYRRWRKSEEPGAPYFMYVDEFQNFSLGGFEEIVAEARKFGLGLILAHQNFDQLEAFSRYTGSSSARLRNAVISNTANRFVFGVSSRDAAELTKELDVDQSDLRSPGTHRAIAQVLFDLKQHSFTLETSNADSNAGLPDQYDAIRRRMIDRGFWRRRDELRDQDAARAERMKLEVQRWKSTQPVRSAPFAPQSAAPPAAAPKKALDNGEVLPQHQGGSGDHVKSWLEFLKTRASQLNARDSGAPIPNTGIISTLDGDEPQASLSKIGGDEYPKVVLNEALLIELGLNDLPEERKPAMLRYIYDQLELRVGRELADQMSHEQLDEFEALIDANDDAGAFRWLQGNFPEYRRTTHSQFGQLKDELRAAGPSLLEASQSISTEAPEADLAADPGTLSEESTDTDSDTEPDGAPSSGSGSEAEQE